jgi:hypothetical protein
MKLSDEDKQGLSADEIKALEQAEEGEGENLLKVDGEPAAAQKDDDPDGKPVAKSETELDLIEADEAAPAPAPKFTVDGRDFKAELATLRAERSAIEEQWTAGEIDDAARNAQLGDLEDKRDTLVAEQTRAATLLEINQQNEQNALAKVVESENAAIVALIAADAKAGDASLNYKADLAAQKDFDVALTAIKNSSTHASKSPSEHVAAAHRMVLSMRGIAAPAATPTPKPAGRREVPPSLGGLPDAGRAEGGVSDEAWNKFSTLKGEAAERFLGSLPEHEVDRLTRMADNKMFS